MPDLLILMSYQASKLPLFVGKNWKEGEKKEVKKRMKRKGINSTFRDALSNSQPAGGSTSLYTIARKTFSIDQSQRNSVALRKEKPENQRRQRVVSSGVCSSVHVAEAQRYFHRSCPE